jgi:hypothetical protein
MGVKVPEPSVFQNKAWLVVPKGTGRPASALSRSVVLPSPGESGVMKKPAT